MGCGTVVEKLIRIPTTMLTPSTQNIVSAPFTSQYGMPVSQLKLRDLFLTNPLGTSVTVTIYDIVYTGPGSYTYLPVLTVLLQSTQTTVDFQFRDDAPYIFGGGVAASSQFTGVYASMVVEVE